MAALILRKLYRITGIIFPIVYYFFTKSLALACILIVLALILIIEYLRLLHPEFFRKQKIFNFFAVITKEEERGRLSSAIQFLISIFLIILFFRKNVAITSILFLIFADAISALIGMKFGKIRIGKKTFEGSIGFLDACLFIGLLLQFSPLYLPWHVILIGSVVATLVEAIPVRLDDNFTIGLICAFVMGVIP
ncbi:MAG: hypothetical protein AB1472_03915 [Candidatus Omnitrophota bacterium]